MPVRRAREQVLPGLPQTFDQGVLLQARHGGQAHQPRRFEELLLRPIGDRRGVDFLRGDTGADRQQDGELGDEVFAAGWVG